MKTFAQFREETQRGRRILEARKATLTYRDDLNNFGGGAEVDDTNYYIYFKGNRAEIGTFNKHDSPLPPRTSHKDEDAAVMYLVKTLGNKYIVSEPQNGIQWQKPIVANSASDALSKASRKMKAKDYNYANSVTINVQNALFYDDGGSENVRLT